jgi:ectoine hydroxylase-related dioxygenase (phytanoyl-CoA dioxygenase family)
MLEYTPVPAEQIRQFDEQGYLVIRNVLDDATIAQLIAASDRLIARAIPPASTTAFAIPSLSTTPISH